MNELKTQHFIALSNLALLILVSSAKGHIPKKVFNPGACYPISGKKYSWASEGFERFQMRNP